jgi:predicted nucleic acid-binding protein
VIIADANIISYLLINGPFTATVEEVLRKERDWAAPVLWRSELISVLSLEVRKGTLSPPGARNHFQRAAQLVAPNEFPVDHLEVLRLAAISGCSTYDCEYVWGAQQAGVPLVTQDKKVLATFPQIAVSAAAFVAG